MDLEKGLSALEKFYLDFIGQVLPGAILLCGVIYVFNPSLISYYALNINLSAGTWLFGIFVAYILGYAISSLSKITIIFAKLARSIVMIFNKKAKPVNEDQIAKDIFGNAKYKNMISNLGISGETARDLRDARNLILSKIKPEDNLLIRRFTFIYLLNIGVATSLSIVLILSLIGAGLKRFTLIDIGVFPLDWRIDFIIIVLIFAFIDRYLEFYSRSIRTPFSIYSE